MRKRIPVMAGVIVLVALVWAGGGWGMTFEEMEKEMRDTQVPGRTYLDMYYFTPMVFSGNMGMKVTELCVAGDRLRPKDPSKANIDMGKSPPGNQFMIPVYHRFVSESGDHIILYYRAVELPACK
jgi:hypothetical protein